MRLRGRIHQFTDGRVGRHVPRGVDHPPLARRGGRLARGLALATALSVLAGACIDALGPNFLRQTTLFVAPQLVPCVGIAPQSCMLVREPAQQDWQLFYDGIAGFTFEPGYEVELRVRIYRVPNPPADGSSLEYRLVRVLRKSPARP